MQDFRKAPWTFLSGIFLLFMLCLACGGAYQQYSPVPYWDMWSGTLQFYADIEAGRYQAWWAQHNEHRIFLARQLFWLDYSFFGGKSLFLIVVNYCLVGFSAWVFRAYLGEANANRTSASAIPLSLFVAGALFLWTQHENLVWAFQSQFFLAQSLPLYGLLWMARHVQGNRAGFSVACLLGVLSPLAMANGMLALPVMALYLLLMRQSVSRILVVLALWLLLLVFYLSGYSRPDSHGHPAEALYNQASEVFRYVFLYLGSPFNHMVKGGWVGWTLAMWSGLLLLLATAGTAVWQFRKKERSPYAVALLCFIGYILCTALITAAGRLVFGLPQALSARYTTPALMAWAALLVTWHVGKSEPLSIGLRRTAQTVVTALALAMLSYQLQAIRPADGKLAGKRIAALALAMGVRDEPVIALVTPDIEATLAIVRDASARHHGIFGSPPFADVSKTLGKNILLPATAPICDAVLSLPIPIKGDENYLRIGGRLRHETSLAVRQIRMLDAQGQVIGLALSTPSQKSMWSQIEAKEPQASFDGYLLASATGMPAWLAVDDVPLCRLSPDGSSAAS